MADSINGTLWADMMAGSVGNDTIYGNDGADFLAGDAGNDALYGGDGRDTLDGGDDFDSLYGGAGDDILIYDPDDKVIQGNEGTDWLLVNNRDNTAVVLLEGSDIENLVVAGTNDTLAGNSGNNVIIGRGDSDSVSGGDGNDLLYGDGSSSLLGGAGNDVLIYNADNAAENVQGGAGNDILDAGWMHTGVTINLATYSAGDIEILRGGYGADSLAGNNLNNTITGGDSDDVIYGNAGADKLYGGRGADVLDGGAGNDTLAGADGTDTYQFGVGYGNDVIVSDASNGDDQIIFTDINYSDVTLSAANDVNGNYVIKVNANDSLTIQGWNDHQVTHLVFADGATVDYSNGQWYAVVPGSLTGDGSNNTLYGNDESNRISGLGGDDILYGNDGADTLDGGTGNDILFGGAGNDVLVYDPNDLAVNIDGGTGMDTLSAAAAIDGVNISLSAGYVGIEALLGGSGADTLAGGAGNDLLVGGSGNDILSGNLGNDVLAGGAGNDVYVFNQGFGHDTLIADANDTIVLGDGLNIPHLEQTNDGILMSFNDDAGVLFAGGQPGYVAVTTESGLELRTILIGNDASNSGLTYTDGGSAAIFGLGGDDTLTGGNGDDMLAGGNGDDLLIGKSGSNTYYLEENFGSDTIDAATGNDALTDRLYFAADPGEVQQFSKSGSDLKIAFANGNSLTMKGWYSTSALQSIEIISADETGQEFAMLFQAGNDSGNTLNANDSYTNHVLVGLGGNDTINGASGSDDIFGGSGNDYLRGNDGEDTFHFEGTQFGNDTIVGETGSSNDRIVVDNVDGIQLSGNDLILKVMDSATKTDASSIVVSNWLTNTDGRINITTTNNTNLYYGYSGETREYQLSMGSNGNDTISFSGYADNVMYAGQNGSDSIVGGSGDDFLYGDNGYDTIYGGAGNDQIYDGGGNDVVYGGDGGDFLRIGGGNDSVSGGLGNDVYRFGKGLAGSANYGEDFGNDTIMGSTSNANDIIFASNLNTPDYAKRVGDDLVIGIWDDSTGNDFTITIEDWYLGSAYQIGYYKIRQVAADGMQTTTTYQLRVGNENGNLLDGTSTGMYFGLDGNDTLYGSGSGDIMNGGSGNDLIAPGSGNDLIVFNQGMGNDTLYADANDTIVLGDGLNIPYLAQTADGILMTFNNDDSVLFVDGQPGYVEVTGENAMEVKSILIGNDNSNSGLTYSGSGDAVLFGLGGNDTLTGNTGDDVLSGGNGNDLLVGKSGSNTYFFEDNFGSDTIDLSTGNDTLTDTIYFGNGAGDSPTFSLSGSNLSIAFADGTLTLKGWTATSGIQIVSPDGDSGEEYAMFFQTGTNSGNMLTANDNYSNNVLVGLGGADSLIGGDGTDNLFGGTGDDSLVGGAGEDYYEFNAGDGNDTISGSGLSANAELEFSAAIGSSDFTLTTLGSGVYKLTYNNGNDSIVLKDFASGLPGLYFGNDDSSYYFNGETYELNGDSTGQTFTNTSADETFTGGSGSDIYMFTVGNGNDTITANSGNSADVIQWGTDVERGYLSFARTGNDLTIWCNNDSLTIQGYYNGAAYEINNFYFTNPKYGTNGILTERENVVTGSGSTIMGNDMNQLLAGGKSTNDSILGGTGNEWLSGWQGDDSLFGGEGDDWLYGQKGKDVLFGGTGSDLLSGGGGNDILNGNEGADYLEGNGGDDTLLGGAGDDLLFGGAGNDIYAFEAGFGNDTLDIITDNDGLETLYMARNSTMSDPEFVQQGNNLLVDFGNESLLIQGWYTIDEAYRFMNVVSEEEDGTNSFMVEVGSANDDVMSVSLLVNGETNELYGLEGNDLLAGGAGDDALNGGSGSDTLTGGAGNDTYLFYMGDGADFLSEADRTLYRNDVISFGDGIVFESLTCDFSGDSDYLITYAGGSITILNEYDMATNTDYLPDLYFNSTNVTYTYDQASGTYIMKV